MILGQEIFPVTFARRSIAIGTTAFAQPKFSHRANTFNSKQCIVYVRYTDLLSERNGFQFGTVYKTMTLLEVGTARKYFFDRFTLIQQLLKGVIFRIGREKCF